MAKSTVIFGINHKRYPYLYDRSQLKLGTKLFVGFDCEDNAVQFSSDHFENSRLFVVNWIATSEWYVLLEDKFIVNVGMEQKVISIVEPYIEAEVVKNALNIAARDIRLEHSYKTKEFEKSRLSVINTVVDRFGIYRKLQNPDVCEILFNRHQALSVYLLLTCFDRLGQPSDWLDFGSWLQAEETKEERDKCVNEIKDKTTDIVKISLNLYSYYNSIYGVRLAFFRFLENLLPSDIRRELFDSFIINKIPNPPALLKGEVLSDKEKGKYLFKIRNNFTHKAKAIPGVSSNAAFPENFPVDRNSWVVYEQWHESDYWFSVDIRNWPEVFEKVVRVGLAEYLKNIQNSLNNGREV